MASSSLSYCAYKEGPPEQRARIRQSIEEKRVRVVGFGFNNYTPTLKLLFLTEIIKRNRMVIRAGVASALRVYLLTFGPPCQYSLYGTFEVSNDENV